MPINLEFQKPYLSIKSFSPLELPDFALITGINGSGKSHFLSAIASGSISVRGINQTSTEIRYFDWNSLVPKDQPQFRSNTLQEENESFLNKSRSLINRSKDQIRNHLYAAGLSKETSWSISEIHELNSDRAKTILSKNVLPGSEVGYIKEQFESVARVQKANLQRKNNDVWRQLEAIERRTGRNMFTFDDDFLKENGQLRWGTTDLFQQSFARIFVVYRDALVKNQIAQLRESKGIRDSRALTDDEFERRNGIPPWDFLNTTLADAGLDFIIDHPSLLSLDAYTPQLSKRSTGDKVSFSSLSSGEKVLMSFATCLYYANDGRTSTTFPKLMLLDEVDAPLHPTMSRSLIDSITNTLVGKFGIRVIAATHSPSTVAMTPDENVFVMNATEPRLEKIPKSKAINLLTAGVPTLSVSFDGRREVFVESGDDVELYDLIYNFLKPHLASERSLTFIATGKKTISGDVGTGCDQVRRIVKSLRGSGNSRVFGIIDWDHTSVSTESIKVLAEGRRDGLENCILDPILVAFALHRVSSTKLDAIGISSTSSVFDLGRLPLERLQEIADQIQLTVLDGKFSENDTVDCSYAGGGKLRLQRSYLEMDDHALEERVLDKFPELKSGYGPKGLKKFVCKHIFRDLPHFIPSEFCQLFNSILDTEFG